MRSYMQMFGGLLVAAAVIALAGCANDDNPGPVQARDLGDKQKGEVLVPYEPVVARKIAQDPSVFPMPAAPVPVEAPATAPVAAEAPAAAAAGPASPTTPGAPETPAAAPNMASLPPSPEAEKLAAQLMDDLGVGKYVAVEARFGPKMKEAMPPDMLKMQWNQATAQLGQFESIEKATGHKVPKDGQTYDYAEAVLKFSRGTAVLMVAFDSQKQIVQLQVVPGQVTAPARASDAPAAAPGGTPPAPPSRSGSGSANMDILPPTAPAPVGLGN